MRASEAPFQVPKGCQRKGQRRRAGPVGKGGVEDGELRWRTGEQGRRCLERLAPARRRAEKKREVNTDTRCRCRHRIVGVRRRHIFFHRHPCIVHIVSLISCPSKDTEYSKCTGCALWHGRKCVERYKHVRINQQRRERPHAHCHVPPFDLFACSSHPLLVGCTHPEARITRWRE